MEISSFLYKRKLISHSRERVNPCDRSPTQPASPCSQISQFSSHNNLPTVSHPSKWMQNVILKHFKRTETTTVISFLFFFPRRSFVVSLLITPHAYLSKYTCSRHMLVQTHRHTDFFKRHNFALLDICLCWLDTQSFCLCFCLTIDCVKTCLCVP